MAPPSNQRPRVFEPPRVPPAPRPPRHPHHLSVTPPHHYSPPNHPYSYHPYIPTGPSLPPGHSSYQYNQQPSNSFHYAYRPSAVHQRVEVHTALFSDPQPSTSHGARRPYVYVVYRRGRTARQPRQTPSTIFQQHINPSPNDSPSTSFQSDGPPKLQISSVPMDCHDSTVLNDSSGKPKSPVSFLICASCGEVPTPPVTGPCGHSRCRSCCLIQETCPCGMDTYQQICTDVLVQRMSAAIERLFKRNTVHRLREWHQQGFRDELVQFRVEDYDDQGINVVKDIPEWYQQVLKHWLKSGELECILCVGMYRDPVTTPCGHTYCRSCIERTLGYRFQCPLCSTSLEEWDLDGTRANVFVATAVSASGIPAEPEPYNVNRAKLPIFICTIAYPQVPCPLYVFEPRYRLLIKRCIQTQDKLFGMVVSDDKGGYVDFGTILEIRDCVRLPSGGYLISTMGISRFHVRERSELDGYDVAVVDPITDLPSQDAPEDLEIYFRTLREMSLIWLRNHMSRAKLALVRATYGEIPSMDDESTSTPDGPAWTWWLMALLPLSFDLKIMVLSSPHLSKRMLSAIRVLYILQSYRYLSQQSRVEALLTELCLAREL